MSPAILGAAVAAPLSWALVGLTRRYLVRRGIVDVPNNRSSHAIPTPRGGGLAVVAVVMGGIVVSGVRGWIPAVGASALIGGGGLIALIGWIDDRRNLTPVVKLLAHLVAAFWAVYLLGGFDALGLGHHSDAARWFGLIASLLVITWSISAFNFMDGLDALAASEAAFVGFVGGTFAILGGSDAVAFLAFLLGAASLGFLPWNLPPARVFLGDVGSGFLGYCFVVLALMSERQQSLPAAAWFMLLGVFAFDSTVTLLRRLVRGERWNATHRESAYQRLAQRLGGHGPVAWGVFAVNGVLAALCWLGIMRPELWPASIAVATVLLTALYLAVEWYAPVVTAASE